VRERLSEKELATAMDPKAYLGESERIVRSVVTKAR
jgi:adenylosuccinate lyase